VRTFDKRAGTGEKKGHKRMAETGAVFDVAVPDGPARTPEQVMRPEGGSGTKPPPRAENRWYTCDITAGRDVTIGKVFDEAERRDPGHARTWIALIDGDIYQLGLIQAQAGARGITLAILVDFIHVLEYLWKAAWCFHAPRDPAMEDWVTAQALDILHGRAAEVITRIAALAEEHPPKPGGEHARIIRKTLHYLTAKQPWMDYPRVLANGWPIATGVIEGACRHLVADRMASPAPLGPVRSPGHALAARHRRQRRHQIAPKVPRHQTMNVTTAGQQSPRIMAGYPAHRQASAGDHAGSSPPPGARLGHVIRYTDRSRKRRRNNHAAARAGHQHGPARGRRLPVLAAVCQPQYPPRLHQRARPATRPVRHWTPTGRGKRGGNGRSAEAGPGAAHRRPRPGCPPHPRSGQRRTPAAPQPRPCALPPDEPGSATTTPGSSSHDTAGGNCTSYATPQPTTPGNKAASCSLNMAKTWQRNPRTAMRYVRWTAAPRTRCP